MKITMEENSQNDEIEIIIKCAQQDSFTNRIIELLNGLNRKLVGTKADKTYILDADQVLYFESVDKHVFMYTKDAIYETALKLYELEELLVSSSFLRTSKSTILNFDRIQSLRPDFGGRILVTMCNGEKLYVSRQYANAVKKKLGVKP